MQVQEKRRMELILPENSWESASNFQRLENVPSRLMKDLPFIMVDNCERKPNLYEVDTNVFKNKKTVAFAEESIIKLRSLIATIEVESNPDIMEALKESKKDKKAGRVRKFEDIARECGLRDGIRSRDDDCL